MCAFRKTALVAAYAVILSLNAARAADAPQGFELTDDLPAPLPVVAGGWYLRGDVGFSLGKDPDADSGNPATGFFAEKIDNTGLVGGGLGYRLNSWMRTDITVDHRLQNDFSGNALCVACGNTISFEHADIHTTTFLVNFYVDLIRWQGFAPYVGAGAGLARHRVENVYSVTPSAAPALLPAATRWAFAGTVIAGASYDLDERWAIDGSYRYVWLGSAKTGRDAAGFRRGFDGLAAHEIRLGLRYAFN